MWGSSRVPAHPTLNGNLRLAKANVTKRHWLHHVIMHWQHVALHFIQQLNCFKVNTQFGQSDVQM